MSRAVYANGDLRREIRAIFADKFGIRVDAPEKDLLQSGLVDSVTLVELVLALEGRFGVTLPFESLEIDDLRTIDAIGALVERAAAAARPQVSADRV